MLYLTNTFTLSMVSLEAVLLFVADQLIDREIDQQLNGWNAEWKDKILFFSSVLSLEGQQWWLDLKQLWLYFVLQNKHQRIQDGGEMISRFIHLAIDRKLITCIDNLLIT